MYHCFYGISLSLVLGLTCPAWAADQPNQGGDKQSSQTDQKKKGDNQESTGEEKTKPKEKLKPAFQIPRAEVVSADESKKIIKVKVPYVEVTRQGLRIVRHLKEKEIEIPTADDVKVRVATLPKYDDKGNIKHYTAKEKRERKGPNKKLPGYQADFDSLSPGQIVKIWLGRKKAGRRVSSKDKELEKEFQSENKPLATMVEIMGEKKK